MKEDGTLTASEISEYSFCSVAWYMDQNGYPRGSGSSRRLEMGREMHRKLEPRYNRVSAAVKISLSSAVFLIILFMLLVLGLV